MLAKTGIFQEIRASIEQVWLHVRRATMRETNDGALMACPHCGLIFDPSSRFTCWFHIGEGQSAQAPTCCLAEQHVRQAQEQARPQGLSQPQPGVIKLDL